MSTVSVEDVHNGRGVVGTPEGVLDDHRDFFASLPALYSTSGIDLFANELRFLDGRGHLHIEETAQYIAKYDEANSVVAAAVAKKFGAESNEAKAAIVAERLAPYFNEIFLKLTEHVLGAPIGVEPHSWAYHAPKDVEDLQKEIESIILSGEFMEYFAKSPETKNMLAIVATRLVYSHKPEEMREIVKELEQLAIASYQIGLPVLLFGCSEYYTSVKDGGDKNNLTLEPSMRLGFPVTESERARYQEMTNASWDAQVALHNSIPGIQTYKRPKEVIVRLIMGAGSEFILSGSERFEGDAFIASDNLYKHVAAIARACELAHLQVTDDDIRLAVTYLYILHELGHVFFEISDQTFEELDTDLSMAVVALRRGAQFGFSQELLIAALVGEYADQASVAATKHTVADGYRKSGVRLVNALVRAGLVTWSDDRIHIHSDGARVDELVKVFVPQHRDVHLQNPADLLPLMNEVLDHDSQTLVGRITRQT